MALRHVRHSHPHEHAVTDADGTVRLEQVSHPHHHVEVTDLDLPTFVYKRARDKGILRIRPWGEPLPEFPH